MKYKSGRAFRQALEVRLKNMSFESGQSLVWLRKIIAFDRFLARLLDSQPNKWILKGGFALQLRLREKARTTKDIDVLTFIKQKDVYAALREAGNLDLKDWFQFEASANIQKSTEDMGGTRYQIQALLDGRVFEKFHIDVGIGDPILEAVEYLQTPDLLTFADIAPAGVPCYPITQQVAEKLHAYTRPYPTGASTRVKDFVDILILADLEKLDGKKLLQAIQSTFQTRGTHPLPKRLPEPPKDWVPPFRRMSKQIDLGYHSLQEAFKIVQAFLNPVLDMQSLDTWYPSSKEWK